MQDLKIRSYGKINLSLGVVNKRDDGYHNIKTIMQEISLYDELSLRPRDRGIVISSNDPSIPLGEDNLVYKAYEKLRERSGLDHGLEVHIEKNIPMAAGLAGGSSNAAATLKGLNQLWQLGYSLEELQELGLEIGADLPFCLLGGTAYAEGVGEKLRPLRPFKDKWILLANIGQAVSTPEVYKALNRTQEEVANGVEDLIDYVENDDIYSLADRLENQMEAPVIEKYPKIEEIKLKMLEAGALGSLMTGSGPTVFGIFDSQEKIEDCQKILKKDLEKVFITRTR